MKAPAALIAAVLAAGCSRPAPPAAAAASADRAGAHYASSSPESASYRVAGRVVALQNGKHDELAAPGSAVRNTTTIWGTPLAADLDADGDQDAIVILANEPGGSGTFYYVAAAELDAGRYLGSAAVLLGDRIAPQNVEFADGVVTVNFAERRPGQPMSTPPSVGVSRRFLYTAHELREHAVDEVGDAL